MHQLFSSPSKEDYNVFTFWLSVDFNALSEDYKVDAVSPFWVEPHDENSWDIILNSPQFQIYVPLVMKAATWKSSAQEYKDG